jgi:hypothetical protein
VISIEYADEDIKRAKGGEQAMRLYLFVPLPGDSKGRKEWVFVDDRPTLEKSGVLLERDSRGSAVELRRSSRRAVIRVTKWPVHDLPIAWDG